MYQSESFYLSRSDKLIPFTPSVTSAYKILADNSYLHICTEEEKELHSSETTAFIRCISGQGKIYLQNKSILLKENEFIFVKFHDLIKYKSLSTLWAYRWVNCLSQSLSSFELNRIYESLKSENEEKAFDNFISAGNLTENAGYINALFLNYFYIITEENKREKAKLLSEQSNKLIDDICAFIMQKLYEKLSVSDVSVFFGITPRRLHQIFSKELGISPKQYIIKKKMEEGYRLLVQTSAPVNQIAEMLYFSSSYHFTNEFKKTFGQTPTAVRAMEVDK